MGYLSTVDGSIVIDPPLTAAEMRGLAPIDFSTVQLNVIAQDEEVDEGTLTVRRGVELIPITEESYKAYMLEEDVTNAVTVLSRCGAGHHLSGCLEVSGEGTADIWRLTVDYDGVRKETARVVWPDGSEWVRP